MLEGEVLGEGLALEGMMVRSFGSLGVWSALKAGWVDGFAALVGIDWRNIDSWMTMIPWRAIDVGALFDQEHDTKDLLVRLILGLLSESICQL